MRCTAWIGKLKESGTPVLVVFRKGEQMYRGIHSTMTEARKAGILSWMLDAEALSHFESFYGIRYVIMVERETADLWVSRIEDWSSDDLLYKPDPSAKRPIGHGMVPLKALPVHHMLHLPAESELIVRSASAR